MSTAGVQGLEPGRAVPFRPVLRLPRPLVRFGAEGAGGTGRPPAMTHGRPWAAAGWLL
jgi:hypothetical protein